MRPSSTTFVCLLLLLLFSTPTFTLAQARGRVLYPLPAYPGCAQPLTTLVADADGNLYGTGSNGGDAHGGCVFELSPAGAQWAETVVLEFNGADGSDPRGGLVFDGVGNLYGTAGRGGTYDAGVAFELSPSGDGAWTETVLYNFGSRDDAAGPECNLIFDSQGNLYGTAGGGPNSEGTVFRLSPSGTGWTETILYSFSSGINGPGGTGQPVASSWIAKAGCMASPLTAASTEAGPSLN
jgi:uncharacterized repeat protein (TIGR03803 family)